MEFRDLKIPSNNKVNRPINSIFISSTYPIEIARTEDSLITKKYPDLTKRFARHICNLVDIVSFLEVENYNRILRLLPTSDIFAKTRFSFLRNTTGSRINFYESIAKPIIDLISKTDTQSLKSEQPKPEISQPQVSKFKPKK